MYLLLYKDPNGVQKWGDFGTNIDTVRNIARIHSYHDKVALVAECAFADTVKEIIISEIWVYCNGLERPEIAERMTKVVTKVLTERGLTIKLH